MKKALLPIAIIAAMPFAAFAEPDVTVYGRAHVSVDYLDNGDSYSEFNMSSNSSRLGFRASTEIEGLTAMVQIEQQVDFDSGNANASNRDTFLGVQGGFGTIKLGRFDTPFKKARGSADLFGDQLGDIRNITRVGNARFDERNFNTVQYESPRFGNAQLILAYSIGDNSQTKTDGAKDDSISAALTYKIGLVDFSLAYETYGEDHTRGERDGIRGAASYQVVPELMLVGFFQTIDHKVSDALSSDVYGIGAEYKITGKTRLKAHYLMRDGDVSDTDAQLFAVGLEHRVGGPLRVYLNYAMMSNDDNVALTPYAQARTTGNIPTAAGETAKGLSLGLRYDF